MNPAEIVALAVALTMLLVAVLAYAHLVISHLDVYAEAVDKAGQLLDAEGWWARIKLRLEGWKTVLLSLVAVLAQLAQLLDYWLPQMKDLPWGSVLDQKTANVISLVCGVLIPLVHAQGLAKAATTVPVDQG